MENFVRKYFIEKLWQNLVNYNLISTANYLAERYLIPIANQLNDTVLVLKLTQFKNLSIGNPAPDFILDDGSGKKLSELDIAENYILVFWSSGCSHCLKEIPQLYQLSQELNTTKYKIIAVGLEEDTFKWTNEVVKYPNFINIDLLSIDVEGHEKNVLDGLTNDKFNAKLIIIESDKSGHLEILEDNYIPYLTNGINLVYISKLFKLKYNFKLPYKYKFINEVK